MSARCARCGSTVKEEELPRLADRPLLCPSCKTAMELAAMTRPPDGQEDVPTLFAKGLSGGTLSDDKSYALVVLSGKEPGRIFPIVKARVTIGRSDCDIVLDDTELSRQHALISISGTSARLEDLGSTNGTYVGENRVEQAALEDRSEFRIGNHELLFLMTDREDPR